MKKKFPAYVLGIKTANIFSYLRIVASAFVGYFLWMGQPVHAVASLIAGVLLDMDGKIARATHTESEAGRKLDNFADGVLAYSSVLFLFLSGYMPEKDAAILAVLGIPPVIRFATSRKESSLIGKFAGILSYTYIIAYMLKWKHAFLLMLGVASFNAIIHILSVSEAFDNGFKHSSQPKSRKRGVSE